VSPEIHTLAGAYALHALSDIERRQFEEHLAECPDCQQQVAEFHATAARLATAVAEQPSNQLRQRVLAEIGQTRQDPPPVNEIRGRAGKGKARQPRRPWAMPLIAAAAVLVALAFGVLLGQAKQDLDTRRDELTTAQARYQKLAELLSAPDLRTATGQSADGDSSATVAVSRQLDQGVLTTAGLPAAPARHTYQAWLIGATGPRSAGVFDPSGTPAPAPLIFSGLGSSDQIGVTVEPAGGSLQPTTKPILLFPMPA
jgi:anti-sigma-K factor RskA